MSLQAEISTSLGNIDFITLHRGMVGVVAVVGDLPGEVGSPEERVCDKADDVVDGLVGREGGVAALVTNDPDTSEDKTLEPPAVVDDAISTGKSPKELHRTY
jgi:hypothetical protein